MSFQVHDSGSSTDSGEGEEQDEPSSSSPQEEHPKQIEDVLSSFRERWQKELQISPGKNNFKPVVVRNVGDYEAQAKTLFLKGVELEKAGKLYESIQFYRRAVQLVPDIEFRLDNFPKTKVVTTTRNIPTSEDEADGDDHDDDDDDDVDKSDEEEVRDGELLARIQKKLANVSAICIPKNEQNMAHISVLPPEMILYILKWVVSTDLDLRSLEMFSMVCRGFYLCARDSEIWRLVCLRVWGLNCGNSPLNFISWRQMFIERARLQFNGCYIGKTTYIRHGENSFQDQFYRPWHLVSYYRYLRFFPEGAVLVLTSSDDPAQCVSLLKNRNARSPVLKGYYRLKDDKVTVVVQKSENKHLHGNFKKMKRRVGGADFPANAEQTFHMELQIKSTNKKRHVQLVWTHYSVFTRTYKGDENTCNFDLANSKFPPFWFSRVKSYTSESESPLQ